MVDEKGRPERRSKNGLALTQGLARSLSGCALRGHRGPTPKSEKNRLAKFKLRAYSVLSS